MFIEAKGPSIAWYPPHAVSLSSFSRSPFAADCSISIEWRTEFLDPFLQTDPLTRMLRTCFFCVLLLFSPVRSSCVRVCICVTYCSTNVCSAKSSSLFFCKLRGENLGIFYWISKTVRARIAVVDHLLRVVSLKDTKFSFGDIDFYFSIDWSFCTLSLYYQCLSPAR